MMLRHAFGLKFGNDGIDTPILKPTWGRHPEHDAGVAGPFVAPVHALSV
jgi:hypothetical protein